MSKDHGLSTTANKLLWALISLALAAITFWLVLKLNGGLSPDVLWDTLREGIPLWIGAGFAAMLVFIGSEAHSLRLLCKGMGHRITRRESVLYSAADIYFSAITPSATGGQPASAFLMIRGGVPDSAATAAHFVNIMMYTLTLAVAAVLCLIFAPGLFLYFGLPGRVLILVGIVLHVALTGFFFLLVRNERLLHRICAAVLRLLERIHLIRRKPGRMDRLDSSMEEYRRCTAKLHGRRVLLLRVFLTNLLMRCAQLSITMFVFLAAGHSMRQAFSMWALQSYVLLGVSCIPIPGSMGVSDYLMLDAFSAFLTAPEAASMELTARFISFYSCAALCGLIVLGHALLEIRRRSAK